MLAEIPEPKVLDPGRIPTDDREQMSADQHHERWKLIASEFAATCDYAQELWSNLAAMRQYLRDCLPPEHPHAGDPVGASPIGPDDDKGWERWQIAFASVTSVLCGPRGDNHLGEQDAVVLAQNRRVRTRPAAAAEVHVAAQVGPTAGQPSVGSLLAEDDADSTSDTAVDEPGLVRLVGQPLAFVAVGALAAIAATRGRLRP